MDQIKTQVAPTIAALALAQAASVMFDSLGAYKGNVHGLLDAIAAGFALEEHQGSRAVETEMHRIFGEPGGAKVSELFTAYRLDELPKLFHALHIRLLNQLANNVGRPVKSQVLSLASLPDGAPVRATVTCSPDNVRVQVCKQHAYPEEIAGKPQMVVNVQAFDGQPVVYLSNELYGDTVLAIHATPDGFYLEPESAAVTISHEMPAGGALAALDAKLHPEGEPRAHNQAFVDTTGGKACLQLPTGY